MAKQKKTWAFSPARDPKSAASAATKAEVEKKANELIASALTPKHIQPPPENPKNNYVTGLSTKWHGRYFYFVATYACPGPNAISPTFEVNFARLEHTALGKFNLAYMRHTGAWHELFAGLTLDECLTAVRDDPLFQP